MEKYVFTVILILRQVSEENSFYSNVVVFVCVDSWMGGCMCVYACTDEKPLSYVYSK